MRVIAECGGNQLLMNNYLNMYVLGLVAMEGLFLGMRICRQADSHGALVNSYSAIDVDLHHFFCKIQYYSGRSPRHYPLTQWSTSNDCYASCSKIPGFKSWQSQLSFAVLLSPNVCLV